VRGASLSLSLSSACYTGVADALCTPLAVWEVLSTPEAREAVLDPSSAPDRAFSPSPDSPSSVRPGATSSNGAAKGKKVKEAPFTMPVFASRPVHEFKGHEADVLDLSWSKVRLVSLILSSSCARTPR